MKHNVCSPINNWEKKQLKGKDYIVAPVVILTEGVHNGLYYPNDELKKGAHLWNGVPLVVHHPLDKGMPISANNPSVVEAQQVGRLYNVIYNDGKLKGQVYVSKTDIEKFPEVSHYLDNQLLLEVSTGLFSDDEMINGKWNDEMYTGICRNHKPDHLALLPGKSGACSASDGCGIRINGMSHSEIQASINKALSEEKGVGWKGYFYIREVYEDKFIYEEEDSGDGRVINGGKLYERNYSVASDGEILLGKEMVEVKESRKFLPVINAAAAAEIYEDNDPVIAAKLSRIIYAKDS